MTFYDQLIQQGMSPDLAQQLAAQAIDTDAKVTPSQPISTSKSASAGPLETAKPLNHNSENLTPPPSLLLAEPNNPSAEPIDLNAEPPMLPDQTDLPTDPPPNKPGQMGTCGATMQRRLPEADEFIDERGTIMPHGLWRQPKPRPKRRKLASLGSLADIERELARLYADYHHLRIDAAKYTRGVYGLTQLATVMRMGTAAQKLK